MASNLNLSYVDYGAPGATSGAAAGTFTLIQEGGNMTSLLSPDLAHQVYVCESVNTLRGNK